MTRLLVVVPCRDERAVLGRRLSNLARGAWPRSELPHRLVVVDDGSVDGTADLARELCGRLFDPALVACETISNARLAGKSGAVRSALDHAAAGCELVVLTDADVVHDGQALVELARAFADEPGLALACAAQTFVASLHADGSPRAADGAALVERGAPFDHATARVRAFESRFGALWSLHGQLCAWRTSLQLAPRSGIAADDLDLVGQVRARSLAPRAVRVVRAARFYEVKCTGAAADGQALRRARAWFQAMRQRPSEAGGLGARLQGAAYRLLPRLAPALAGAACALALAAAAHAGGFMAFLAASSVLALALAVQPLRHWAGLLWTIERAARLERRGSVSDHWRMERG